jgi:hypothetical protein
MRAIISKIMSMLSGGGTRRSGGRRTSSRGGMLSRVLAAVKAFFSGGRSRRY